MTRAVFINGFGSITPFGGGNTSLWQGFIDNKQTFANNENIPEGFSINNLVAIIGNDLLVKSKYFHQQIKRFSMTELALKEALVLANKKKGFLADEKVGIFLGLGAYLNPSSLIYQAAFLDDQNSEADSFDFDLRGFLLRSLNLAKVMPKADYIGFLNERLMVESASLLQFIRNIVGGTGEVSLTNNLCVSSLQALGQAYRAILFGDLDYAIVGGVEELSPISYLSFNQLGAYSQTKDANLACMPFDKRRMGIVLGEAAGFLVLSKYKDNAIAEILGYANSNNCYHLTDSRPDGAGLYQTMQKAIDQAQVVPDLIIAHGTGTKTNDFSESKAIQSLELNNVFVSSIKSRIGHTLAAAGVFNVIAGLLQMQNQFMLKTLCLEEIDEDCQLNHVLNNQEQKIKTILTNAASFAGVNTSLLFKNLVNDF